MPLNISNLTKSLIEACHGIPEAETAKIWAEVWNKLQEARIREIEANDKFVESIMF